MKNIIEWIEEKLVPVVSKMTNGRYFHAIRNGFFAIMPLTIIGSIFMLITDFPITGYNEFISSIFGEGWVDYISPAYRATFNMMGFVFAGTMSYKLAERYKIDKLIALIFGLVAYVIVLPKSLTTDAGETVGRILEFDWLGTKGILTAILMSIVSTEILNFCIKKKIIIRMPDSVPEMVSTAFSSLIPGVIIALFSLLINALGMKFSTSFPQLIYDLLQVPLQGIIGTPFAIILVAGLNGLLWWFGIHPTVINSMLYPILYANADKNQSLFEVGKLTASTGNFGTVQMLDQFATIGGAGCTIGLAFAMIILAKSARMKAMSKLASIPAVFNINEPLIFGLPVIFNPLMLIPVSLAPIASVLLTFVAMKIGFMPMFTSIQVPWATPFIFSGFLTAGWQGAVVQLVCVITVTIIYIPFIKALDNQYINEEGSLRKEN